MRMYERGQLVSQPGLTPAALRILIRGRLCIYEVTPDGRRLVFEYMEAGGSDGMLELAGLGRNFSMAESDCEIACIAGESLTDLIRRIPQLASNLFTITIEKLNLRQAQLQWLCLRDPSQRLASQLLSMARTSCDDGGSLTAVPRISHEGLADMLALRRETVTLHLGRLRRQRLVEVEGDRFLLDVPGLNAIADGSPSTRGAGRRRDLAGDGARAHAVAGWLAGVAGS